LLDPDTFFVGQTLSIGIYRLAFAVMFERTLTQFMKNAAGEALPRYRALDMAIKGLVLVAAFEALLPRPVAVMVLASAAALLFARLATWKPLVAMRTFGIGIMYAGYLGLVMHLGLSALRHAGVYVGTGSLATHVFVFVCMGLVIPAMLIRISQGHTGRKLVFTRSDRVALLAMAAGAFFRVVATQVWPDRYVTWIALSAIGWSACFVTVGVRLTPFLFQARVDGREH
ncbi:MAG: NnrS family protein, partial [Polyangiaceae bacterium]|nr:NnrS family protein [Polyangiaceae bacterium]